MLKAGKVTPGTVAEAKSLILEISGKRKVITISCREHGTVTGEVIGYGASSFSIPNVTITYDELLSADAVVIGDGPTDFDLAKSMYSKIGINVSAREYDGEIKFAKSISIPMGDEMVQMWFKKDGSFVEQEIVNNTLV